MEATFLIWAHTRAQNAWEVWYLYFLQSHRSVDDMTAKNKLHLCLCICGLIWPHIEKVAYSYPHWNWILDKISNFRLFDRNPFLAFFARPWYYLGMPNSYHSSSARIAVSFTQSLRWARLDSGIVLMLRELLILAWKLSSLDPETEFLNSFEIR